MLIELGVAVRRANAASPRASGGFPAHSNSAAIKIRMENIGEVKIEFSSERYKFMYGKIVISVICMQYSLDLKTELTI
jgi:hypothetical protein